MQEKEIGRNIKKYRKQLEMTQEDVGRIIGVNRSVIQRYESGLIAVPYERIYQLAEAFGISPVELMGLDSVRDDSQNVMEESRPIWPEDIYAFLRAALSDDRYSLVVHAMEVPDEDIQYADRFLGSLKRGG